MEPSTAELEARMREGGWYTQPLLGSAESLTARIEEDCRQLHALELSAADLGAALVELLEAATRSDWHRPARVGTNLVEIHHRRGVISCPWADQEYEPCSRGDGGQRAGLHQFHIHNRRNGQQLGGFVFTAHLIREHSFFGGLHSVFRIEPLFLAALLG